MEEQIITQEITSQPTDVSVSPASHLKEFAYKPGQSGNPSGRPKMTSQQKELMKNIRELGPKAYKAMIDILDSPKVMAMAKVKVIELILNYNLGKPESNIKLTIDPVQQTIASEMRIAAMIQNIKIQLPNPAEGKIMENNYTPEQMQRMGLIVPDEEEEEE